MTKDESIAKGRVSNSPLCSRPIGSLSRNNLRYDEFSSQSCGTMGNVRAGVWCTSLPIQLSKYGFLRI